MTESYIYVVLGETGIYVEDSARWEVVAYADQELAKQHAELAEAHAKAEWENHPTGSWRQDRIAKHSPYDPHMWNIDEPATYRVVKLPLRDTLPG